MRSLSPVSPTSCNYRARQLSLVRWTAMEFRVIGRNLISVARHLWSGRERQLDLVNLGEVVRQELLYSTLRLRLLLKRFEVLQ